MQMPICIAGMHRSGTSMVSDLLHTLGIYMGEEADLLSAKEGENAGGFWEHFGFYALNERLLLHLRAGWDAPWMPDNWEAREDLAPFREEARLLVNRMREATSGNRRWGWKDPRNSITIQFWKSILPDAKVVICVRNPVEVAASLCARNNLSVAAASRLWLRYYENILTHVPRENRVITIYENYFDNFEEELGRVSSALGIAVDHNMMVQARAHAKQELHHNRSTPQELHGGDFAPELIQMYDCLLEEARTGEAVALPISTSEMNEAHPALNADAADFARSRFNAEIAQREEHMRRLSHENSLLKKKLAGLEQRLGEFAEQLYVWEEEKVAQASRLSTLVGKAMEVHRALGGRYAELLALHNEVNRHLKETKSFMPRWVRRSETLNYVYRSIKSIHRGIKLLRLQKYLNDAMAQNLDLLTQVAAILARNNAPKESILPGLECSGTDKTKVDIARLTTVLRQRLS